MSSSVYSSLEVALLRYASHLVDGKLLPNMPYIYSDINGEIETV